MTKATLTTNPDDLTLDILNRLIAEQMPGLELTDFTITESHLWGGGNASSAGRIVIEPAYAGPAAVDMPRHIVIKVARALAEDPAKPNPIAGAGGALYRNEVAIYNRLKPSTFVEAPRTFGGAYDPSTNAMMLLMEDLRDRDCGFAGVTKPTSLDRMRSILDQLATLHARFWASPELDTGLGWMEWHTKGHIYDTFNATDMVARHIAHQVETEQFKREMVERLGTNADGLFRQYQTVLRHQATLPATVCHGDTHIGNTYILPGDRAGLLDWQLTSKGFALHDVSYVIATALSVEERRTHERDLLAYYREQLLARGIVDPPRAETLWFEYRAAMIWGFYIGWLTTPVVNYGWEVSVMAHLRMATAYEDLETGKAIESLA